MLYYVQIIAHSHVFVFLLILSDLINEIYTLHFICPSYSLLESQIWTISTKL